MESAGEAPQHEVAVIGAGFAGIGAGIKLKQAGIEDFVILERADGVGGTWRDNTYPNLSVDIPSFTYQYSFEKNPDWSRVFAPGDEIRAYADHCVRKYGLSDHLRFGQDVAGASFDEESGFWRLRVDGREITARFVIAALGALTQPKPPDIPGLEDFAGNTVHTARWDHDLDLSNHRVGVIGTGATGVQVIPWLARHSRHQYVFQRTPIWVMPKPDAKLPSVVRAAFRHVPLVQESVRLGASAAIEVAMTLGVVYNRQAPFIARGIEALAKAFIRSQVPDRDLQEQLIPKYGFGCKRPSMSNDYYRTYMRADTDLVTSPIERVTPTGIRTADGVHRELDTLVLATGYLVTEPENAPSIPVHGRDGLGLREFWAENRLQAYEGTSNPGFPNFFLVFGPYSVIGSSWMFMIEYQVHHAIRVITEARRRGAAVAEIRREPHDEFFAKTQRRMQNTIFFNNNCGAANSYYFDSHGDAPFLRPSTMAEAWLGARRFPLDDYRYESPVAA
jgi:cation diffusion facilitator CzcD-associated flavoprotein CzcO